VTINASPKLPAFIMVRQILPNPTLRRSTNQQIVRAGSHV